MNCSLDRTLHRIDACGFAPGEVGVVTERHRTGCADGTHRPDMQFSGRAGRDGEERRDAADSSHSDPDLLLFCTNSAN